MILLKEYIKNKISELEGTKVQEKKAKSKILVQHYFKISKIALFFNDIILSSKDIKNLDKMFIQLLQNKPVQPITELHQ